MKKLYYRIIVAAMNLKSGEIDEVVFLFQNKNELHDTKMLADIILSECLIKGLVPLEILSKKWTDDIEKEKPKCKTQCDWNKFAKEGGELQYTEH